MAQLFNGDTGLFSLLLCTTTLLERQKAVYAGTSEPKGEHVCLEATTYTLRYHMRAYIQAELSNEGGRNIGMPFKLVGPYLSICWSASTLLRACFLAAAQVCHDFGSLR